MARIEVERGEVVSVNVEGGEGGGGKVGPSFFFFWNTSWCGFVKAKRGWLLGGRFNEQGLYLQGLCCYLVELAEQKNHNLELLF